MSDHIKINCRAIGEGSPAYIIAEMSANHNESFDEASQIIHAARAAGADAVKLQTYTADTMTIDCDKSYFRIGTGTIWEGRDLYDLYREAYTPWEWQPKLKQIANDLGLDLFSSPFDVTAVEFLEKMDVPAHKIASFEIVDLALIRRAAQTGKPVIISTGMATKEEIREAIDAARSGGAGATDIALLKCTSAYPAPAEDMNLQTIRHMSDKFGVPVGLSDHTMGIAVPIAAVCSGACIIEKHLTISRAKSGPDSAFSLEPEEFKAMVEAIRTAEKALGTASYTLTESEVASRVFRRSLFVVEDIQVGDQFTAINVRSVRPGHGLPPKHLSEVLGRHAIVAIERGTPLTWNLISS